MTKLKTLKDIENHRQSSMGKCWTEQQLKQEAIAWIKALDEDAGEMYAQETLPKDAPINAGARAWIKKFFNLTDKDLKASPQDKK